MTIDPYAANPEDRLPLTDICHHCQHAITNRAEVRPGGCAYCRPDVVTHVTTDRDLTKGEEHADLVRRIAEQR